MPQMEEYRVPQNSLDDYYLTYSVLPSQSDSFWSYTSTAIFSPEDLDVSYAWDVTSEYFLVIECHLGPQVDSVLRTPRLWGAEVADPYWKFCRQ